MGLVVRLNSDSNGTTLEWFSIECGKKYHVCFGFASLRSVIGWQNSRHFSTNEKRRLRGFALNSDWFVAPFSSVLIG